MGRSGIGVSFTGGSQSGAEAFADWIWDEIVYGFLRSRCTAEHQLRLLHSDYFHDANFERTVDAAYDEAITSAAAAAGQSAFSILWWFHDSGPSDLCIHWLDLTFAYRKDKILAEAKRRGLVIHTNFGDFQETLEKGSYGLYIDTGSDLIRVERDPLRYDDEVHIYEDLAWSYRYVRLAERDPRIRRMVHQAVESGLCGCPVCLKGRQLDRLGP